MVLRPQMEIATPDLSNRIEPFLGLQVDQAIRLQNFDAPLLTHPFEGHAKHRLLSLRSHRLTVQGDFRDIPTKNSDHLSDHPCKSDDPQVVTDHIRSLGVAKRPDEFV